MFNFWETKWLLSVELRNLAPSSYLYDSSYIKVSYPSKLPIRSDTNITNLLHMKWYINRYIYKLRRIIQSWYKVYKEIGNIRNDYFYRASKLSILRICCVPNNLNVKMSDTRIVYQNFSRCMFEFARRVVRNFQLIKREIKGSALSN